MAAGGTLAGWCKSAICLLDRLDDFEAFELRVAKIKWGVALPDVPCIAVSGTECLRLGPALERRLVRPDRVTGIQDVVLPLRPAQKVELNETRNFLQMRVAAGPNLLERGLRPQGDLEAVHGDIHAANNPPPWWLHISMVRLRPLTSDREVAPVDQHRAPASPSEGRSDNAGDYSCGNRPASWRKPRSGLYVAPRTRRGRSSRSCAAGR